MNEMQIISKGNAQRNGSGADAPSPSHSLPPPPLYLCVKLLLTHSFIFVRLLHLALD